MNWTFSREDADLVDRIVDRAADLAPTVFDSRSRRTALRMDLLAVHDQIDLASLVKADGFNLLHDVCGLRANINRTTGELMNNFVLRYTRRDDD